MHHILYIVVPCYNEEEVLPETTRRLTEKMNTLIEKDVLSKKSRILYVNDGSRDKTWEIIEKLHEENPLISGVKLSRNRGHQNALLAGLSVAKDRCDIAISMDADLQDDIDAIDSFIENYENGCDIVYGVRSKRDTDTAFKRITAEGYYKVLAAMGVEIVFNHADYRLMSRRALEKLFEFNEVNLFLRGIVPQIGFKTASVTYERHERFAGESKYPLKKMLALAADGITSFSVKPLRFISFIGALFAAGGGLALLILLICLACGCALTGTGFIISCGFLLTGVNLLALGIVGEYVGKIYSEVKARPRFIIEQILSE